MKLFTRKEFFLVTVAGKLESPEWPGAERSTASVEANIDSASKKEGKSPIPRTIPLRTHIGKSHVARSQQCGGVANRKTDAGLISTGGADDSR